MRSLCFLHWYYSIYGCFECHMHMWLVLKKHISMNLHWFFFFFLVNLKKKKRSTLLSNYLPSSSPPPSQFSFPPFPLFFKYPKSSSYVNSLYIPPSSKIQSQCLMRTPSIFIRFWGWWGGGSRCVGLWVWCVLGCGHESM